MKLQELITDNIIQKKSVESWEEAIHIAGAPLIEKKIINPRYLDAIIENVHQNGTYMVLFDYFAIPHARPDQGSLEVGMSFLILEQPVIFLDKAVKYFLLFSSGSNDQHIELIQSLGKILSNEELVLEQLEYAKTTEEILNIFKGE
ncbi:MAG: PTS sugar transporter subunit IIA [Brevinema sp.]